MLFIQVHSSWSLGVNSVISGYYGFSQVYFIPVIYEHLCWLVFTMSRFCHFGNLLRQHFSSVTMTFQKLSIYKQTTPSGSLTVWLSGNWTKDHWAASGCSWLLLPSLGGSLFWGRNRVERHQGRISVSCARVILKRHIICNEVRPTVWCSTRFLKSLRPFSTCYSLA